MNSVRWNLLKINIKNGFRRDTAFFGNNISNMLSTVLFTVASIAFIELLFNSTSGVGGFNKNDFYLLTLIGQVSFYIISDWGFRPAMLLSEGINRGSFDFLLLKPAPLLWNQYTQAVSPVISFRDALPSLLPLMILTDFADLSFTSLSLLAGLVIFIMGIAIELIMLQLLAMVSFWTGAHSHIMMSYFWVQRTNNSIPAEQAPSIFKGVMLTIMPSFISTTIAVSVILQKTSVSFWMIAVSGSCMAALCIRHLVWNAALKEYSSASS